MSLSDRLSRRLRAGEVIVIDVGKGSELQAREVPIFADISPEMFALEAERWVAHGVQLVGGCCGIRPDHIRALEDRLPSQLPAGTTR